jgi:hypothetical protein
MKITVFRDVTPCSLVDSYQFFCRNCCLCLWRRGSSMHTFWQQLDLPPVDKICKYFGKCYTIRKKMCIFSKNAVSIWRINFLLEIWINTYIQWWCTMQYYVPKRKHLCYMETCLKGENVHIPLDSIISRFYCTFHSWLTNGLCSKAMFVQWVWSKNNFFHKK